VSVGTTETGNSVADVKNQEPESFDAAGLLTAQLSSMPMANNIVNWLIKAGGFLCTLTSALKYMALWKLKKVSECLFIGWLRVTCYLT
jgi:hypothetical protein